MTRVAVMIAGPSSSIKAVLNIRLDRPRDVHAINLNPEFFRVYSEVWGYLREEVPGQLQPSDGHILMTVTPASRSQEIPISLQRP